jgi:hypothetical protein
MTVEQGSAQQEQEDRRQDNDTSAPMEFRIGGTTK